MNFKNLFMILLVFVAITDSSGQEPPLYSRIESYRALRLTYQDLSRLLLDVQEFVQGAATDTLTVQSGWVCVASAAQSTSAPTVATHSEKLTLTGNYGYTAFTEAPHKATSVIYQFHATKHPITTVSIRLEHQQRDVTVVGTSELYVQRLSDKIRQRLKSKEQGIIIHAFLLYGQAILYFVLFALPFLVVVRFREMLNHAILTLIALGLYAMLCRYVMAENLWAGWFPATEIRHGSLGLFFWYSCGDYFAGRRPVESRDGHRNRHR